MGLGFDDEYIHYIEEDNRYISSLRFNKQYPTSTLDFVRAGWDKDVVQFVQFDYLMEFPSFLTPLSIVRELGEPDLIEVNVQTAERGALYEFRLGYPDLQTAILFHGRATINDDLWICFDKTEIEWISFFMLSSFDDSLEQVTLLGGEFTATSDYFESSDKGIIEILGNPKRCLYIEE